MLILTATEGWSIAVQVHTQHIGLFSTVLTHHLPCCNRTGLLHIIRSIHRNLNNMDRIGSQYRTLLMVLVAAVLLTERKSQLYLF